MIRKASVCLIFTFALAFQAMAQVDVGSSGTLSGTLYSDYYWFASSHNEDIEGQNGFWFRRVYLTYDHQISETFSGRVRMSADSEGDFDTPSNLEPTLKDVWLRWSNGDHSITGGITSTPTWGEVEDTWVYRSVEKSPLDLYGFGDSREFGVSFKGDIGPKDRIGYHAMIGNGNGRSTELNRGKKLMLALSYDFTEHLVAEVYGDWNDQPGATDVYTGQAFIGYRSDAINVGALYARQHRSNVLEGNDDLELDLVSFFAHAALAENLRGLIRVDRLFDKNPAGPGNDYLPMSGEAEPTFINGGVDITLHPQVHLIPNVQAIIYKENEAGVQPRTDLVPRLTLFFTL